MVFSFKNSYGLLTNLNRKTASFAKCIWWLDDDAIVRQCCIAHVATNGVVHFICPSILPLYVVARLCLSMAHRSTKQIRLYSRYVNYDWIDMYIAKILLSFILLSFAACTRGMLRHHKQTKNLSGTKYLGWVGDKARFILCCVLFVV